MPAPSLTIDGIEQLAPDDQTAVTQVLGRLFAGFARRDADLMTDVFTDDADWVNAFGSVKRGAPVIIEYLRGLFSDQNFDDGTIVDGPECSLRLVGDDAVVVSAHLQVAGQGLVDGGAIALRDNRSLHVLSRQPDASWRIVSEMFMDARHDQSYIHHS